MRIKNTERLSFERELISETTDLLSRDGASLLRQGGLESNQKLNMFGWKMTQVKAVIYNIK